MSLLTCAMRQVSRAAVIRAVAGRRRTVCIEGSPNPGINNLAPFARRPSKPEPHDWISCTIVVNDIATPCHVHGPVTAGRNQACSCIVMNAGARSMVANAAARSSADHTADRSPPPFLPATCASGSCRSTDRPYFANLSARGFSVARCCSFTCRAAPPPSLPPARRRSSLMGSPASRCSIADASAACSWQASCYQLPRNCVSNIKSA